MKNLQTNKLYFKKWPYKITCYLQGSHNIVRLNDSQFDQWIRYSQWTEDKIDYSSRMYARKNKLDDDTLLDIIIFKNVIKSIEKSKVQFRVESGTFTIYLADDKILEDLKIRLEKWIKEVWTPTNKTELDYLLNNSNKKILCNELPYKKFKYKVKLDCSKPFVDGLKFLQWTERYPDKIKLPKAVFRALAASRYYFGTPYLYVADEKTTSMVVMYLGQAAHSIEEYIPRNSINTPSGTQHASIEQIV